MLAGRLCLVRGVMGAVSFHYFYTPMLLKTYRINLIFVRPATAQPETSSDYHLFVPRSRSSQDQRSKFRGNTVLHCWC